MRSMVTPKSLLAQCPSIAWPVRSAICICRGSPRRLCCWKVRRICYGCFRRFGDSRWARWSNPPSKMALPPMKISCRRWRMCRLRQGQRHDRLAQGWCRLGTYRAAPEHGREAFRCQQRCAAVCCSRAKRACSDLTRASLLARSSRSYSSLGDVPIFRRSSFTASENFDVSVSYSIASRAFSSQNTL